MATTPTITFCDKIVAVIAAAWAPTGNNEVARAYQVREQAADLIGRKVWVFPREYGREPDNRGEDGYDHLLSIVCAERYAQPGIPNAQWIDERVDFVHTYLVDGLFYAQQGPLTWSGRSAYTTQVAVTVCDLDKLTTTPALFWSQVDIDFRELRA